MSDFHNADTQDTSAMNLSYVLEKIERAEIVRDPFRHIEIDELFEPDDFRSIVESPEIKLRATPNDEGLFEELFARDYKIIEFPGCTEDYREYIAWHRQKKLTHKTNTSCEGYGVVLRLQAPRSAVISELQAFFESDEFVSCIAGKFGINPGVCDYDAGLQKYLDGYEISPHPDIRKKGLTYMVNVNSSPDSMEDEYHTSYLKLKPQWKYVSEYWSGNEHVDRCWVPWEWCDVVKQQRRNNSIVMFSPGNDTIHAVKAAYDHLTHQRTQFYGNLWFSESAVLAKPKWEDFNISTSLPKEGFRAKLSKHAPRRLVTMVRKYQDGRKATHAGRNIS